MILRACVHDSSTATVNLTHHANGSSTGSDVAASNEFVPCALALLKLQISNIVDEE